MQRPGEFSLPNFVHSMKDEVKSCISKWRAWNYLHYSYWYTPCDHSLLQAKNTKYFKQNLQKEQYHHEDQFLKSQSTELGFQRGILARQLGSPDMHRKKNANLMGRHLLKQNLCYWTTSSNWKKLQDGLVS